jgi:hypothetical protein
VLASASRRTDGGARLLEITLTAKQTRAFCRAVRAGSGRLALNPEQTTVVGGRGYKRTPARVKHVKASACRKRSRAQSVLRP